MSNPTCCHCLVQHLSLLLPPVSRFRALKQSRIYSRSLCNRSFRCVEFDSTCLKQKREVCCFRHEESFSGLPEAELVQDKQLEKLGGPELDQSSVAKKDLVTSFKEAADVVFRIPGKRWTVPWTAETILQVMLLWIASFWFVGSWIVPFLAHAAGFSKESLTYRGQALYSLLTDVAEGLAGIAILHRCLSRFQPLPSDWFRFNLGGNWQFDVGLGCLMFPLVNRLSQVNLNLVPHLPSSPITVSSVEQSIVARDPVAMVLYAIVVAICAPMWEEIVFRGFLLPSLTKYMPVWCSILVSSVVFAIAHFNAQRMLPLILLGMVMGAVFTRSRNLFASMLLHSLWNCFVFIDLMK
ncbi:hypothetical protein AQUCO_01800013v1 [Aquilegia coerulea]|uniref:CAAX prenyl protease 2/Lysostaphin resistance protein A-like domain-containing protein n=1 Tax=Aquilegia coerulea TaxID=218851 RepID=A0A2G5DJG2_AQUCA|nr:hypothetical protein AQUCO_01800013v1 [Aquilegia coerulea]